MDVKGKVTLVTGASSGIGAATAREVHRRGGTAVLVARRADRLEQLAGELDGATAVVADVATDEGRRAMVDVALAAHGRIDVLINNAGQGLHVPLEEVALDDLRAVLELNVVAALGAMQAVLPAMRAAGGGSIVNVSSGTTRMVPRGVGAYAASKAALNLLSAVARAEFADDGIVVSTVYPSVTATEFHDRLRAGSADLDAMPILPHTPEQVAVAICELVESGEPERVLAPTPRR